MGDLRPWSLSTADDAIGRYPQGYPQRTDGRAMQGAADGGAGDHRAVVPDMSKIPRAPTGTWKLSCIDGQILVGPDKETVR
jgi:hypothetical protein